MTDLTIMRKTDAMDREADLWTRLVAAEGVVAAVRHSLEHSRYAVNEDIIQAMREGGFWGGGAEAMTIDAVELERMRERAKKDEDEGWCDCSTDTLSLIAELKKVREDYAEDMRLGAADMRALKAERDDLRAHIAAVIRRAE